MAVSNVNGTSASSSTLATSRQSIADNFDTFLQILTTQLKNQNPLDPMDTNQFTQQLVQFTGVEQQLKTNEFLEALLNLNASTYNVNSTAVNYIGKEVTANTPAAEYKDGSATWSFNLAKAAKSVTFEIKDASGNVVDTAEMANVTAGDSRFQWDGKLYDGTYAPPGSYTINVVAKDINGNAVTAKTSMTGIVQGVDMSGSEPYLIVGNGRIALGSVSSVRQVSN